jgi:hypothetical protein
MKNKKAIKISVIVICSILMVRFIYHNFFTRGMVVGRYINTNFKYGNLADIPNNQDTLTLLANNHFISNFYGKGTYTLNRSITGTDLDLIYANGTAIAEMPINRLEVGTIKFVLSYDLDRYYCNL